MRVRIELTDDKGRTFVGEAVLAEVRDKSKALTRSQTAKPSRPLPLTQRILILRSEGFFKVPKTSVEVHTKIVRTYPCDLNRVTIALRRLHICRGT